MTAPSDLRASRMVPGAPLRRQRRPCRPCRRVRVPLKRVGTHLRLRRPLSSVASAPAPPCPQGHEDEPVKLLSTVSVGGHGASPRPVSRPAAGAAAVCGGGCCSDRAADSAARGLSARPRRSSRMLATTRLAVSPDGRGLGEEGPVVRVAALQRGHARGPGGPPPRPAGGRGAARAWSGPASPAAARPGSRTGCCSTSALRVLADLVQPPQPVPGGAHRPVHVVHQRPYRGQPRGGVRPALLVARPARLGERRLGLPYRLRGLLRHLLQVLPAGRARSAGAAR